VTAALLCVTFVTHPGLMWRRGGNEVEANRDFLWVGWTISAGGMIVRSNLRISCCPPSFRPSTCLDCLAW
jgi:hypothetical protein